MTRDFEPHLQELEDQGYTLLPGFVDRETTAAIRGFIDQAIAANTASGPERGSSRFHHRICHPIEDPITARLASEPKMRALATRCLRAENLRLRQQMFMLTLPCGAPSPSIPDGWHIDTTFLPQEWEATPRQVFLQVFVYCNPARTGGAATMVVPGSHKATYAAAQAADCRTEEARWAFAREVVRLADIDTSRAVELTCEEGDVALFNPMLIHSGSRNVTTQPRYAFHCSFHDASASRIRTLPAPTFYDTFPESMIAAMPAELRALLKR